MNATNGPEGPSDDTNAKRTEDRLNLFTELAIASNRYRLVSAKARKARLERDRLLAAIELDQTRGTK